MAADPKWLSVAEVAERLAISAELVGKLVRSGRLAAVDHGTGGRRCYRVTEAAVEAYLESVAVTPDEGGYRMRRRETTYTRYV